MTKVTIVRLDLAKSVFQVHGADKEGRPVVRKKLRQGQVLAFFAGLSHWIGGLCLSALLGPGVTGARARGATDPTAVCAPLRQDEQERCHGCGCDLRSADAPDHAVCGGEVGGTTVGSDAAPGASKVTILIEMIEDRDDARLPALAREALGSLVEQLRMAQTQILDLEKQLKAWHRTNEASRRLEAIPGCRDDHRHRPCGDDRRCLAVPLRASTCRLAGPGSKTVFQQRQGAARAHIQARRRLSPSPFSSWRARRSALV